MDRSRAHEGKKEKKGTAAVAIPFFRLNVSLRGSGVLVLGLPTPWELEVGVKHQVDGVPTALLAYVGRPGFAPNRLLY